MKKTIKTLAVALTTAATIAMPFSAEAHYLSSAQEKEIGNQAVADFMNEFQVEHSPLLEHIQKRIMLFNSDKLWMYGTPGRSRGLEPVLLAKLDRANAVSYGGGQIFINEGMLDHLATMRSGAFSYDKNEQTPWKKSNIYQMSSLAAVMGHEMGHWENEDMLYAYDRTMDIKILTSLGSIFAAGNVWAALGLSVGSNLANAFNSRDLGFKSEQSADEKAMEYAMYVPEYSVGGEAIVEYREYQYKIMRGIEDEVKNWLHPHSKTAKRLARALKYQEDLSKGFIKWTAFSPSFNGIQCRETFLSTPAKRDFDATERSFYVTGQIATAIHFDFCKERCLRAEREDVIFADGSPNNVVLLLEGHGSDFKDHTKIIDTYYNLSMQDAKFVAEADWEKVRPFYELMIHEKSELGNLLFIRKLIHEYDANRSKYVHKKVDD